MRPTSGVPIPRLPLAARLLSYRGHSPLLPFGRPSTAGLVPPRAAGCRRVPARVARGRRGRSRGGRARGGRHPGRRTAGVGGAAHGAPLGRRGGGGRRLGRDRGSRWCRRRGGRPGVREDGQESRYCSHAARFSSVPMTTSNSSTGSSPSGPASGVATTWLSHTEGGVRKNPMGRSKARANATSSSAVISRMRPPSTDRSRADQLAGDSRAPRYGAHASAAWSCVQPRSSRALAMLWATIWLGVQAG